MAPGTQGGSLNTVCCHFPAEKTDVTTEFVRGRVQGEVVEVPTYATIDLCAFRKKVEGNVRAYGYMFLSELVANGAAEIVQRTFREAFEYAVGLSLLFIVVEYFYCSY